MLFYLWGYISWLFIDFTHLRQATKISMLNSRIFVAQKCVRIFEETVPTKNNHRPEVLHSHPLRSIILINTPNSKTSAAYANQPVQGQVGGILLFVSVCKGEINIFYKHRRSAPHSTFLRCQSAKLALVQVLSISIVQQGMKTLISTKCVF